MSTFDIDTFLVLFPSIVFEAIPFIILGALISGALEELLPQRWIASKMPQKRHYAVAASAFLGLAFPMCECGIVPVMRRLLGKGLPLGCAVAYMLAAPIINPVVIASTWAAFSGNRSAESGGDGLTSIQMVAFRVGFAFVTAFIVGLIIDRVERKRGLAALVRPIHSPHPHHHHHDHEQANPDPHHGHAHSHEHEHQHEHGEPPLHPPLAKGGTEGGLETALAELPMVSVHDAAAEPELQRKSWGQRLSSISETALHDFVDIACFLIIGAILASLVRTLNVMDYLPQLSNNSFLAAPVMMILAIVLCLCSEADAFVAANLVQIPLAGKLSFLVLGPMLDLKLFFMYTRVFRYRLIWTIIGSVLILVLLLSWSSPYIDEAFK